MRANPSQANPLPLIRKFSRNASAPFLLYPGGIAETAIFGETRYALPYDSGEYLTGGCTVMRVVRSRNVGGGLDLSIRLGQRSWCPRWYSGRYVIKSATSPNTRYEFDAEGVVTRVVGTEGVITKGDDGLIYSAVTEGVSEVSAGPDTVQITEGLVAAGDRTGVVVMSVPEPAIGLDGVKDTITSPPGTTLEVERSGPGFTDVKVTNVLGATERYRVRTWPRYWQQIIPLD